MKKLFIIIVLLLCTPLTHTAAALEDLSTALEIPPYVNQKRAKQLLAQIAQRQTIFHDFEGDQYRGYHYNGDVDYIGKRPAHCRYSMNSQFEIHSTKQEAYAEVIQSYSINNVKKLECLSDKEYYKDRQEIIRHMIEHGINPNAIKYGKYPNPLYDSIDNIEPKESSDFILYLLEHGIDVNAPKKPVNIRVLNIIIERINRECTSQAKSLLSLLLSFGANPDLPNDEKQTARSQASATTQLLIKKAENKCLQKYLFIVSFLTADPGLITMRYLNPCFIKPPQK